MSEHSPVSNLTTEQCWELLHAQEFGRLAFHLLDEVHIVPLNYAVDADRRLVFRTAEGSKLLGLTINDDVAFEIDEFGDEEAHSVVVRVAPGSSRDTNSTRWTSCRCDRGSTPRNSTSSPSTSTRSTVAASNSRGRGRTCARRTTTSDRSRPNFCVTQKLPFGGRQRSESNSGRCSRCEISPSESNRSPAHPVGEPHDARVGKVPKIRIHVSAPRRDLGGDAVADAAGGDDDGLTQGAVPKKALPARPPPAG